MEILYIIFGSSVVAALIASVSNIITTIINNKCNELRGRNTELEAENAKLKQQKSDLEKRLQEYQEKDSVELNEQVTAQNHHTEANSSFFNWND